MAKNQIQFQQGLSSPQFFKQFGTEAQCHNALFRWRWPGGFVCPDCGHTGYRELVGRSLYQCHRCHRQTSVTSGTIFEHTKLVLTTWFLWMYLLTQPNNGISALEMKRQLGISEAQLPRYLAEFCNRFKREDMIPQLGYGGPILAIVSPYGVSLAQGFPSICAKMGSDRIFSS